MQGIGFSDDPLLQGRNFSYFDTQISRLGINWQQLPINRPVCPVMNHIRDGAAQHRITQGKINYWPNRAGIVPPASEPGEGGYVEYAEKVEGMKVRLNSTKFLEHFSQAQMFWNSMSPIEKEHITKALAFELDHCNDPLVYQRMVERLTDIDLGLAQAVAVLVGAPTPQSPGKPNNGQVAKGLSQMEFTREALGFPPTILSRMVAIIIADGFDYSDYDAAKGCLVATGAFVFTIGPKRQNVTSSGGDEVMPDHHWEAIRSTAFDTIYIPGGAHVDIIRKSGRAVHWIREAFGHLKAIGATGEAVGLVKDVLNVDGLEFSNGDKVVDSYGVVTAGAVDAQSSGVKEALQIVEGGDSFLEAYAYEISQHRNYDRELDGLSDQVAY